MGMIGYKAFHTDWTCQNNFQYEVGKEYMMDGFPEICVRGFHFCTDITDTFKYYGFGPNIKYAKVEALGDIRISADALDSKCCTNHIKILEEITYDDIMDAPIKLFGEPCDWTYKRWRMSHAMYALRVLFKLDAEDIEQTIVIHKFSEFYDNPYKKLWKSSLHLNSPEHCRPNNWGRLTPREKDAILSMPNFNWLDFYGITGIEVPSCDLYQWQRAHCEKIKTYRTLGQ